MKLLFQKKNNFHNEWYVNNTVLSDEEKNYISKAAIIISTKLSEYGINKTNFGLIHSDCRFSNILKDESGYIIIDFDDCGDGWYMYDVASVFGFNENHPYVETAKERLLNGYTSSRKLAEADIKMLDTFIMMRQIGLIGTGMFFEKYAVCGAGESLKEINQWHAFYHQTAISACEYCRKNQIR